MSAATTPNPPAANGTPVSAVEYVRGLPPEEKQAVFLALLREALQYHGDSGLMTVEDENGKAFGYYVPPKTSEKHFRSLAPVLTPEQREVTRRAMTDLSKTFEMQAYLDELKQADAVPG